MNFITALAGVLGWSGVGGSQSTSVDGASEQVTTSLRGDNYQESETRIYRSGVERGSEVYCSDSFDCDDPEAVHVGLLGDVSDLMKNLKVSVKGKALYVNQKGYGNFVINELGKPANKSVWFLEHPQRQGELVIINFECQGKIQYYSFKKNSEDVTVEQSVGLQDHYAILQAAVALSKAVEYKPQDQFAQKANNEYYRANFSYPSQPNLATITDIQRILNMYQSSWMDALPPAEKAEAYHQKAYVQTWLVIRQAAEEIGFKENSFFSANTKDLESETHPRITSYLQSNPQYLQQIEQAHSWAAEAFSLRGNDDYIGQRRTWNMLTLTDWILPDDQSWKPQVDSFGLENNSIPGEVTSKSIASAPHPVTMALEEAAKILGVDGSGWKFPSDDDKSYTQIYSRLANDLGQLSSLEAKAGIGPQQAAEVSHWLSQKGFSIQIDSSEVEPRDIIVGSVLDVDVEWQTPGKPYQLQLDSSGFYVDAVAMGSIRESFTVSGHDRPVYRLPSNNPGVEIFITRYDDPVPTDRASLYALGKSLVPQSSSSRRQAIGGLIFPMVSYEASGSLDDVINAEITGADGNDYYVRRAFYQDRLRWNETRARAESAAVVQVVGKGLNSPDYSKYDKVDGPFIAVVVENGVPVFVAKITQEHMKEPRF